MTEKKRKNAPNYGALSLGDQAPVESGAAVAAVEIAAEKAAPAQSSGERSSSTRRSGAGAGVGIRDRSKSVILYLNPKGHKALKQYGLDADRPMQDLILEALETWARSKGLTDPMRPAEGEGRG